MKNSIILTLLLAFTSASFGQQVVPNQNWGDSALYKKSRTQKTVGWIMTGVGTAGLLVTVTADATQTVGDAFTTLFSAGTVEPERKSYTVPYVLSAAVTAGGVYLLIKSAKNRKKAKAASVFINTEKTQVLRGTAFNYESFPVVGLKIRL